MAGDMTARTQLQNAEKYIEYLSPILILVYYLIAALIAVLTLQNLRTDHGKSFRKPTLVLVSLVVASYGAECLVLLINALSEGARRYSTSSNVFTLTSSLVWILLLLSLKVSEHPAWYSYYGCWLIAQLAEVTLLSLQLSYGMIPSGVRYARTAIRAFRILVLTLLLITPFSGLSKHKSPDEESASLLSHGKEPSNGTETSKSSSTYGAISQIPDESDLDDEEVERLKKENENQRKYEERLRAKGNWFTYAREFWIFVPMLWPTKRPILILNVVGVGFCLLCERALTVLEPRQFGIVLDSLAVSHGELPIREVLLYIFYSFISSAAISPIQSLLWLPFEQHAAGSIKTAAYNQIMRLSREFHDEKQSGELYEAIDQGSSVTSLLNLVVTDVLPMFTDSGVAFIYLYYIFGPYMTVIMAAVTVTYLCASTWFISVQAGSRRRWRAVSRKVNQMLYDTVGGWSTVSYFNRQAYEESRYYKTIYSSLAAWRRLDIFYTLSSGANQAILELGLVGAAILAVFQIVRKESNIGNFAMLMTYWGTFASNIRYFSYTQRTLRQSLIDAESLLELLQRKPSIEDGPNEFNFKDGSIAFRNVGFSYNGKKQVLKDFSFHAKPGQKIALVGETGGGKSTVLKLLFRFYDVQEGMITIDDQDIRDVTLSSFRQHIGVVPQDASMFNDTIMANVRYAKLNATDEEIMDACKAAAIHEKILTFADGYRTKVGENGVKLSGGELQRIAIARVILQDPRIILLDEATSAVDTETEEMIQNALEKLTRGRSTITVAHRLSTVTNSDIIIVIKDGAIAEIGSPSELLNNKGKYHSLWLKQIGVHPPSKDEKTVESNQVATEFDRNEAMRSSEGSSASGSKSLRPTAPEFVPRADPVPLSARSNPAKGSQSVRKDGASGQRQSLDPVDAILNSGQNGPQQNHAGHTRQSEPSSETMISDSQPHAPDSIEASANKSATKQKRLQPIHRRRNNQSEPSGSTPKRNQLDGPRSGQTNDISGEDSVGRRLFRRASAPSEPPSSFTDARQSTSGQRRRRRRHSKRSRGGSSSRPEDTSEDGPRSLSGETLHSPTPNAPPTSPADVGNIRTGQGSVHFAPDV